MLLCFLLELLFCLTIHGVGLMEEKYKNKKKWLAFEFSYARLNVTQSLIFVFQTQLKAIAVVRSLSCKKLYRKLLHVIEIQA